MDYKNALVDTVWFGLNGMRVKRYRPELPPTALRRLHAAGSAGSVLAARMLRQRSGAGAATKEAAGDTYYHAVACSAATPIGQRQAVEAP